MIRMHLDEYFCTMATVSALRSTCMRRAVGCVLVNSKNQVLATGYNGVARGREHCIDVPCEGWQNSESGKDLDKCNAIHAEQNALLQCPDTDDIWTAYCTTAPCVHCSKLLANTSCRQIVFVQPYDGSRPELFQGVWRRYENARLETALRTRGFP